jgi:succinate dehydrogenase cytochrome b subunit
MKAIPFMSTSAVGFRGVRTARFWSTTNGKKAVMAVSGTVLALFVIGHLAGNLQIFLGPDQFNGYARFLHSVPELLWPVRVILLVMVLLHIWSSIELAVAKRDARPDGYARYAHAASTYASRTMYMSGPILAAFVIYHLMQFTFGTGGTPFNEGDAYGNVIAGFRNPAISGFYILSMGLLCLHLRHGLWSLFQTLGFYHPRYTPRFRQGATAIAVLIFLGFSSIPAAVLTHLIPQIL